jgi:hypothetical protein
MQSALAAIETHFARCGGGEPAPRIIAQAAGASTPSAR